MDLQAIARECLEPKRWAIVRIVPRRNMISLRRPGRYRRSGPILPLFDASTPRMVYTRAQFFFVSPVVPYAMHRHQQWTRFRRNNCSIVYHRTRRNHSTRRSYRCCRQLQTMNPGRICIQRSRSTPVRSKCPNISDRSKTNTVCKCRFATVLSRRKQDSKSRVFATVFRLVALLSNAMKDRSISITECLDLRDL